MEGSYTLTPDDLRDVQQWTKTPPAAVAAGVLTAFALITLAVGFSSASHDWEFGAALATLYLLVSVPLGLFQRRRKMLRAVLAAVAETPQLVGPRRVRLSSLGISVGGLSLERTYPWKSVSAPRRNSRYFLLNTEGVIPIPLRAFAGRREAELFWTALLAYKMSGGGAEVAPTLADATVWPPPPTSGSPGIGGEGDVSGILDTSHNEVFPPP